MYKKILEQIKRIIKNVLLKMLGKSQIEWFIQQGCFLATRWVAYTHKRLMSIQWGIPPQPEHFDHHIDLFYLWLADRNSLWLERGVFSSLSLKEGAVLELACGDGFNTKNFYSLRSSHIVACDFAPEAIETAKRKNSALNIEYILADIRTNMPDGMFENIIWDAAIEHFSVSEIQQLMDNIKSRLTHEGLLSGYTIVERSEGKSLSHHEYEFTSKKDLLRLLIPHFKNATVFETIYPTRHNLYFWASDATIPFSPAWECAISVCQK